MRVRSLAVLTTVLVIGSYTCLGGGVRAQEAPDGQPARPIAESVERLARELWPVGDQGQTDEQGRPRFRTSVTVSEFTLPLPWHETDPAGGQFRRPGTFYHQQFLSLVTPEEFRGGTLYPVGFGVDPGTILDGVQSVWRGWQVRRARERIEREAAELRARATASPQ
jgi:hypothetical protein